MDGLGRILDELLNAGHTSIDFVEAGGVLIKYDLYISPEKRVENFTYRI